jgi:hypothetical protein
MIALRSAATMRFMTASSIGGAPGLFKSRSVSPRNFVANAVAARLYLPSPYSLHLPSGLWMLARKSSAASSRCLTPTFPR